MQRTSIRVPRGLTESPILTDAGTLCSLSVGERRKPEDQVSVPGLRSEASDLALQCSNADHPQRSDLRGSAVHHFGYWGERRCEWRMPRVSGPTVRLDAASACEERPLRELQSRLYVAECDFQDVLPNTKGWGVASDEGDALRGPTPYVGPVMADMSPRTPQLSLADCRYGIARPQFRAQARGKQGRT